jgi:drug/metabolite transporter (DMT)-like permease
MAALAEYLWVLFTLTASTAQTARNAMQRDLIGTLGAAGATYVRFLFGLPFAVLFLAVEAAGFGMIPPALNGPALLWIFVGATAQIMATGLMLAAMRTRSFVVTIAYTKTEPVIIALFSVAVLGETPTPAVAVAIVVATVGVMLMSWPRAGAQETGWKPAALGVAGGAFFALSAVGFRGGILRLYSESFVSAATTALVAGLVIQCGLILVWLLLFDRAMLGKILRAWRPSLLAGFMGAFASQCWFLAFATSTAAKVRTLGLIEVPMAQIVTRKLFEQGVTMREYAGIGLILIGVALLING